MGKGVVGGGRGGSRRAGPLVPLCASLPPAARPHAHSPSLPPPMHSFGRGEGGERRGWRPCKVGTPPPPSPPVVPSPLFAPFFLSSFPFLPSQPTPPAPHPKQHSFTFLRARAHARCPTVPTPLSPLIPPPPPSLLERALSLFILSLFFLLFFGRVSFSPAAAALARPSLHAPPPSRPASRGPIVPRGREGGGCGEGAARVLAPLPFCTPPAL